MNHGYSVKILRKKYESGVLLGKLSGKYGSPILGQKLRIEYKSRITKGNEV